MPKEAAVLLVTGCDSFEDLDLIEAVRRKGINKYLPEAGVCAGFLLSFSLFHETIQENQNG